MAATTNPLHGNHHPSDPTISSQTFTIAGILTTVYGLNEVSPSTKEVACLWLLHPRLQTQATMGPIAAQAIHAWNKKNNDIRSQKALIAVSFDQRNHGSRLHTPLANEAWRQGNPSHAQDMFSSFSGTAHDTSLLITYLPAYVFNTPSSPPITQHLALGVSLGGHAVWHSLLQDPRVTAGVVGIGCPDYTRVMTDRARLSKLKTWTESDVPGSTFLGSKDFPKALVDAIARYDPAGSLTPGLPDTGELSPGQSAHFKKLLGERLKGKRILNLAGADDKLVPYAAGAPFLKAFKKAITESPELDIQLEDRSFDGVGHAFTKDMVAVSVNWICGILSNGTASPVSSKI